ncbi:similar to Saccharomyces cerevisiae YER167W BCK2 Protein rich in serine and threonine residues involved in protein kinase C signaling pathway, which controls cell integrity [Maudiozyma barnettii]|uniref:Similar to Saccharomyces cerevisiae YER167W BCK2 Protein rich in serine and threonine residues involved in protein kinase C signaling pathway, which controls cell integrity n=1 Tax=Maudiozyma barnettii TaxID=61262 RepID=A0A8H2ZH94_9SACH|nr:Bck2p [Kazachstania barnettii]CAB4255504.1 similar to Saccharomyces cerevisiae YER167W BCK2 Protein rich in serine and threonine residues involved in protein kinase C signaling pathway, which controls cell integrity [Kazachstania barnettii]CAD1784003.1 similar to Saccharomyces cerevisiae YER167W BCK2 Protein rich in serine and threonine residues involved in protein kinase C signaling pathway, which controls cell integrity [Kazachstania barnettii]
MPKHVKTPSFSNMNMTAAGSIVTKSPNDSLSKWKIPHYYKRNTSCTPVDTATNNGTETTTNTLDHQGQTPSSASQLKNVSGMSTPDLSHMSNTSGKFVKSPNFKNLTSPKKMMMDENYKKQVRAKKKGKHGVVFVNYTVQDDLDKMNDSIIQIDTSNINGSHNNMLHEKNEEITVRNVPPAHEISQELFESNLIPSLPQSKPNSKQKSARKRMLKIFGSSKNKFTNNTIGLTQNNNNNSNNNGKHSSIEGAKTITTSTRKSISKPTPLNRSISTPTLPTKEEMVMPSNANTSTSSAVSSSSTSIGKKKSYGSLLKYGKLRSTDSTINHQSMIDDVSFDDMMNEIVPKSNNDNNKNNKKAPRKKKNTYSNLSSSYLHDPQMNTNVASMPVFNTSMDAGKAMEMAMTEQQKMVDFNFQNKMMLNNNRSTTSLDPSNINNNMVDSHQLNKIYSSASSSHLPMNSNSDGSNVSPNSNLVGLGISPSQYSPNVKHEDNDASIAFSKMFTQKKRASTMDSISNAGNKDINTGLSSMNNIYSPIRTVSPARQRSSTRGSSTYRLSRDISSLSSVRDGPENSYLDSQQYTQKVPISNNGSSGSNNNNRLGHRKKQESISEIYRQQQQMINNTVVTPSTNVPFVTPPYFTSNLAIPSSNSTSSTPSVGDISASGLIHTQGGANMNQNVYMNTNGSTYFDGNGSIDNSHNNAMIELSDIQTPLESIPAIDTMTSNTTPMQGTPSNNIIKQTKNIKSTNSNNNNNEHENIPYMPNDASTGSSSALESIMTNSLSTTTSHTLNMPTNAPNMVYQTQDGEPFTLVNTGMGSNDINLNHFGGGKVPISSNQSIMIPQNASDVTNMADDQLIQHMYMEFDFENPTGMLSELIRSGNNVHTSNINTAMSTHSPTLTSVAGPASSSSPSTIVPPNGGNNTFNHHTNEHGNSMNTMMSGNPIVGTNMIHNSGMTDEMAQFNSNTFTVPDVYDHNMNEFHNGQAVGDGNNEMAAAFFLDN